MRSVLETGVMRVAPSMKAQNVANTLWALATLGWQASEGSMRSVMERAVMRVAPSMKAQNVANALWALATLGWQASEGSMRSVMEGAAARLASGMKAQDVANTLWALATLGWSSSEGPTRSVLEGAVMRVALSMNTQAMANTLWAAATLGWQASVELAACFEHAVSTLSRDNDVVPLSTLVLSQLFQAHAASQLFGLGGLVALPLPILQAAVVAYRDNKRKSAVLSAQREVGESLQRLGVAHALEHITADGLFSIDLAIVDLRIALEFDGPAQFTTNTLEPLGHTRLRDRLLSATGWQVVSIPFFEWAELHRAEQKDAYIEERLRRVSSN
jgi:hypothetical protein